MKRLLILSVLLCGTILAAAQTTKEDFLRRYNNLVDRVGPTGVGVETLLDNWAAAYPEDDQQMLARFAFCFARSQSSQVIELDRDRYLGNAPLLPMTDSLGVKHNYFEDTVYDDDLFADALQMIDQAIATKSWKLDYRFMKTNATLAYEKESPDMALQQLKSLADEHFTRHPSWVYEGVEKVGDEEFCAFMQDYCAAIFRIGSDASAEAFKSLSEHLLTFFFAHGFYIAVGKSVTGDDQYKKKIHSNHNITFLSSTIMLSVAKISEGVSQKSGHPSGF